MYSIVWVCLVDWCPWDSHLSLLVGRGWWEPPSLLPFCISPLVPSPLPLPLSLGGKGHLSLRLAETESSWIGSLVWLVSLTGSAASVSLLRKGRLGPRGRWRLALDTCGYQGPFIRPPCWWCWCSLCCLRDTPCIPVRMELTWSLLLPGQGSGNTRSRGPLFWGGWAHRQPALCWFSDPGVSNQLAFRVLSWFCLMPFWGFISELIKEENGKKCVRVQILLTRLGCTQ